MLVYRCKNSSNNDDDDNNDNNSNNNNNNNNNNDKDIKRFIHFADNKSHNAKDKFETR